MFSQFHYCAYCSTAQSYSVRLLKQEFGGCRATVGQLTVLTTITESTGRHLNGRVERFWTSQY